MSTRRHSLIQLFILALLLTVTTRCTKNLQPHQAPESYALDAPHSSVFFQMKQRIENKFGDGISGFVLTETNEEALQWRLMLIDKAEESIDIQTFLWHDDGSANLLARRLVGAAERGVRVRILVDDLWLQGSDDDRAALNGHPHISIRSFNPTVRRNTYTKNLEFITHMGRLNHRMHNKLFVVDNSIAIVGGRNVGDDYFGLAHKLNFVDLDVLAIGKVAAITSESFDIYWNSKWAYPPETFTKEKQTREIKELLKDNTETLAKYADELSSFDLEPREWTDELKDVESRFVSGTAYVVQDEPDDIMEKDEFTQVAEGIVKVTEQAEKEILISSPYYIPGDVFFDLFTPYIDNNITVKIITNSLITNNHTAAHTGYKKFRKRTIEMGAELYEFHHKAAVGKKFDTPPVESENTGLHTKMFVMDRQHIFIGSLNLDPRAVVLNTEMGLIINSPELGERAAQLLESYIQPENSWKMSLDENRNVIWNSTLGTRTKEPSTGFMQRFSVFFLGLMPIENQL